MSHDTRQSPPEQDCDASQNISRRGRSILATVPFGIGNTDIAREGSADNTALISFVTPRICSTCDPIQHRHCSMGYRLHHAYLSSDKIDGILGAEDLSKCKSIEDKTTSHLLPRGRWAVPACAHHISICIACMEWGLERATVSIVRVYHACSAFAWHGMVLRIGTNAFAPH